jgi:hypothetical protein
MILAILLILTGMEVNPGKPACTSIQSDSAFLGGVQAVIEYDAGLLRFESFSAFRGINYYNADKPGEISFVLVNITPSLPQKMAEVCFTPVRFGNGELKLTQAVVSDTAGNRLEVTTEKATVTTRRGSTSPSNRSSSPRPTRAVRSVN